MQTICYLTTEWERVRLFDWSVLGGIDREFFLAGGLQAENLTEAMEAVRPYAVDIKLRHREQPEKRSGEDAPDHGTGRTVSEH